MIALAGFTRGEFTADGATRPVYRRGAGPAVVVIHETPGITPQVAAFGRRVADAGFTAAMPSLFGTPGRGYDVGNLLGRLAGACVSHEFRLLARGETSPITSWLRALARALHRECGGPGVGAIGMCITGNFALALALDECTLAPVLSQPSLPVAISRRHAAAVHLSDADLRRVRDRGVPVLGLRFTHDWMCPASRFASLRDALGDRFEAIEIDSGPGNPHAIPRTAHSVVTRDLVDADGHPTRAALERVLEFFRARLQ